MAIIPDDDLHMQERVLPWLAQFWGNPGASYVRRTGPRQVNLEQAPIVADSVRVGVFAEAPVVEVHRPVQLNDCGSLLHA